MVLLDTRSPLEVSESTSNSLLSFEGFKKVSEKNSSTEPKESIEIQQAFRGLFSLWPFVAIIIIEQKVIISALYCVMTCGLLQGQYGGYQNGCQSASNLLNITFN